MPEQPRSAAASSLSPARKLSPEEAEQVTGRLYYRQQERAKQQEAKRRELLDSVRPPKKPLTKEGCDSLNERLYSQQLERKRRLAETQQKKREESACPTRNISETELTEMVQRMYYAENEKKARAQQRLKERYQPAPEKCVLDKSKVEDLGKRLSCGYKERKEETRKALFDKYIAPLEPAPKKISKEQVKAMADRLCTTATKA